MPGSASYKGYSQDVTDSEYEPSAYSSSPIRNPAVVHPKSEAGDIDDVDEAMESEDMEGDTSQHGFAASSDDIPLSTVTKRPTNRLTPTRTQSPVHYTFDRPKIPPLFNIWVPTLPSEGNSQPVATTSSTLSPIRTLQLASDPVSGPSDFHSPRTEHKIKMLLKGKRKSVTMAMDRKKRQYTALEIAEKTQARKEKVFEEALGVLKVGGCTLAEFLEYVFNPKTPLSFDWRWKGFFNHRAKVRQIFGYWTMAGYSETAQSIVNEWVVDRAEKLAADEAKVISDEGMASKANREVNEEFFLNYSIPELTNRLETLAPSLFRILRGFATTTRQSAQLSTDWLAKKKMVSRFNRKTTV